MLSPYCIFFYKCRKFNIILVIQKSYSSLVPRPDLIWNHNSSRNPHCDAFFSSSITLNIKVTVQANYPAIFAPRSIYTHTNICTIRPTSTVGKPLNFWECKLNLNFMFDKLGLGLIPLLTSTKNFLWWWILWWHLATDHFCIFRRQRSQFFGDICPKSHPYWYCKKKEKIHALNINYIFSFYILHGS